MSLNRSAEGEAPPLLPAQREGLARLHAWLGDETRPFALLLGERGAGKSTLVARWMQEAAQRGVADPVLARIGRREGTALERDALSSLAEALEDRFEPWPRPARNLVELRELIACDLGEERDPGSPPLVVVLDGLDEAIGWSVDSGSWLPGDWEGAAGACFLGKLGVGIRLLVTASSPGTPAPAGAPLSPEVERLLRQLGWNATATALIPLPTPPDDALARWIREAVGSEHPESDPSERALVRVGQGSPLVTRLLVDALRSAGAEGLGLRAADLAAVSPGLDGYLDWLLPGLREPGRATAAPSVLDLLACALGPIPEADLLPLVERAGGRLGTRWPLDAAVAAGLVDRTPDGAQYRYRHGALWSRIEERLAPATHADLVAQIVDLGRATVSALSEGRAPAESVSPYWRRFHGAHLRAARAPLEDFMALATPAWLSVWRQQENAYLGSVTDVRRAREQAEELLAEASETSTGGPEDAGDVSAAPGEAAAVARRASAIVALVRSTLVEGALYSLEELSRADEAASRRGQRARLDLSGPVFAGEPRAHALVALASALDPPDRETVLEWAEEAARSQPDHAETGRPLLDAALARTGAARVRLARKAAAAIRGAFARAAARARETVALDAGDVRRIGIETHVERTQQACCEALVQTADLLPEDEGRSLVREAVALAGQLDLEASFKPWRLAELAPSLHAQTVEALWQSAPEIRSCEHRPFFARLAPHLPEGRRAEREREALDLVVAFFEQKHGSETEIWPGLPTFDVHGDLEALAPALPEALARRALAATEHLGRYRADAVRPLAERLAALGHAGEALSLVEGLAEDSVLGRFDSRCRLVPHLPAGPREALQTELIGLLREMSPTELTLAVRDRARTMLAALPPHTVLDVVRTLNEGGRRITALVTLAPLLPAALRSEVVSESLALDRKMPDEGFNSILQILACADEIPIREACRLLRSKIGDGRFDLRTLLRGHEDQADIPTLVPLITRLGGKRAVVGVAQAIVEVGAWLP